jgi:hypothetical protein
VKGVAAITSCPKPDGDLRSATDSNPSERNQGAREHSTCFLDIAIDRAAACAPLQEEAAAAHTQPDALGTTERHRSGEEKRLKYS